MTLMYARVGGLAAGGGALAVTGSNVPFVGYALAIAGMIAAGLLLIRYSYLARSREPRHAGQQATGATASASAAPAPAATRRAARAAAPATRRDARGLRGRRQGR
jgi:hypothetical protein